MSSQRIILITGGNTGIGFEAVKSLYNSTTQRWTVIVCGRSLQKAQDAVASLQNAETDSKVTLAALQLDVTDDDSIARAAEHVSSTYGRLDVLINNAGAAFDMEYMSGKSTQRQAWASSWDVNVSGAVCLTWTMVPLLLKSNDPRLVFISSGAASLQGTLDGSSAELLNKVPAAGWPKAPEAAMAMSYRCAKTGLNMVMREFARILAEDSVKTWALCPGLLATGLGGVGPDVLRSMGAGDPSVGGDFIKHVVEGKYDHQAGLVIRRDEMQPF